MNKKKLIIILIIVLVVALTVGGVLFYLSQKQEMTDVNNSNIATNSNMDSQLPAGEENINNQTGGGAVNINKQPVDPAEQAKVDVINRAKFFVEMIGTYSPGAQFQNVIDLQPLMTQKMLNWSEELIKRNTSSLESSQERVTTKVLKVEEVKITDESAKVLVNTRRTRVDDSGQASYSQEAEVELLKINDSWKVNNLVWK